MRASALDSPVRNEMSDVAPASLTSTYPEMHIERNVMVRMRDGVHLATDIYHPAANGHPLPGQFPALLERTPYGKQRRSRSELEPGMSTPMTREEVALHFVRAGYVVVYQDCRGRYDSEGVFTKYLSEAEDGYDTARWLVEQRWSNGRFGTMGLSYAAHTQAAMACLNPPGLSCMVLDSGGFSNAFHSGIRQGGAFELKQATWAYNNARESVLASGDERARAALDAEDLRAWFQAMPWREGVSPLRAVPEYETYLLAQWRHGSFDDTWRQVGLCMEAFYDTLPKIPVVLLSSWYDVYVRSTLDNFAGLRAAGNTQLRLIMGPWLHGNRNSTFSGDVSFGSTATLSGNVAESWLAYRLQYFDQYLKRAADSSTFDTAPVRIFAMGGGTGKQTVDGLLDHGGHWLSAQSWPLPETRTVDYYLHADGELSTQLPASASTDLDFQFDPDDPVPTIGGALTSGLPIFEGGAFDQREAPAFFGARRHGLPLSSRPDVLSFETAALEEALFVAGPIKVRLFIASDAPDTDFTAKLIDVYPPSEDYPAGYAMNLTDGILRCRYRNSWEKPELLQAGEIVEISIEPFATANLFARGHRIRLDISSSNFPKYDVNPNTGAPEGTGRVKRIAHNHVFCGSLYPSSIALPLAPLRLAERTHPGTHHN